MRETLGEYLHELKEDFSDCFNGYRAKLQKADKPKQVSEEPSLLDYLPYRSYLPKYGVFENQNSLGIMLKVSHFAGIDERAKQVLRGLINDLPSECTVQIINYASPRIGDLLEYWQRCGNDEPIFTQLAAKRRAFFETGTWQSLLGNRKSLLLRDYQLYFCFSMNKPKTASGIEGVCYQLEELCDKITQGLKGINCDAGILDDNGLADFTKELINPSTHSYKNRTNTKHEDIREHFASGHTVALEKGRLSITNADEKFSYITFEVVDWPDNWRLENSVEYVGQFEGGISIPCPFYITFGFQLQDRESSERSAEKYRILKTKQGDSKLPMFFPKMIEEIEDSRLVSDKLGQGERIGSAQMFIVLCVKNKEQEDKSIQTLKDHFAQLKFKLERVYYDTANTYLCTLPFGMAENRQVMQQLKIPSKKLSGACMTLMPVFADAQNYGSPHMLMVGRRGQLFFFDNYKTADSINGNANKIVVGGSGRGKSVYLQEYTLATLRFNGQIIILDDGRSFQNFCNLLEGDFVDFGGGNFCINPFSLYGDNDGSESSNEYKEYFEEPFIDLVVSILCIVINLDKNDHKNPEIGLYKTIMANAVAEVMTKKGRHGGFADIRDELLNNPKLRSIQTEAIADRIEYVLRAYSDGRYAKYFNGEATVNITNRLTVFEFSDLEHNETLQSSVCLMVVFMVYTKMRKRERRTPLIIDEAWKLLKHPAMRDPIDGIVRRARKYNGCTVVATQRMSDFEATRSEAAAAVLSQSDWKVMLSVGGEDPPILKAKLGMSDAEIEIAQGLTGLKGAYSEFMIQHSNKSWQIGRLLLDKFSAKLYSTQAEEVFAIREMRKQGMSLEDAIDNLIQREAR